MIRGSAQATQAALSHSRAQTNPTVERGPPWRPRIKKLPKNKAAEKCTQTKDKEKCDKHLLCIITIFLFLRIYHCVFAILCLYNRTLRTMNASSWKKAADIVTKMTPASLQASAAATAESQNL